MKKGVAEAGNFRLLEGVPPRYHQLHLPEFADTMLDGEQTEIIRKDGSFDKKTQANYKVGLFAGYTTWGAMFWCGQDVRDQPDRIRYDLAQIVVEALADPKVRLNDRYPATPENLERIYLDGYEGGVAKYIDAGLPLTGRTNPNWWKLKGDEKRTVDAFVIGVTEGRANGSPMNGIEPIPNGTAATFTMGMQDDVGATYEVGKMFGLPEAETEWGYRCFWRYEGRVAEMKVSGWDGDRFRFPMFVRWRNDKSRSDCALFEQLGG